MARVSYHLPTYPMNSSKKLLYSPKDD